MEQQVVLLPVPLDKMLEAIRTIIVDVIDSKENSLQEKLFSRKEVAAKFGISLVTLHQWTTNGLIEVFRVGGRVYYKEEAVEAALKRVHKYDRNNAA